MFHSKMLFLHFIFKAHCSILSGSLLAHLINNILFPAQQLSAFTVGANVSRCLWPEKLSLLLFLKDLSLHKEINVLPWGQVPNQAKAVHTLGQRNSSPCKYLERKQALRNSNLTKIYSYPPMGKTETLWAGAQNE